MTRDKEQAISNLKKLKAFHNGSYGTDIDMAIKVLEQEPCEDAISRQAVLDIVNNPLNIRLNEIIKKLPPVNPKPKTGHWIEKDVVLQEDNAIDEWQSARCDKCGKYHTTPYMYYFSHYDYCPNCGAKMEV